MTDRATVHQRIMQAAQVGRGLRLSADDVLSLSRDDAIALCAANDDEADADMKQMLAGRPQEDGTER